MIRRRDFFFWGAAYALVVGPYRGFANDLEKRALSGDRFSVDGREILLDDIVAPPLNALTKVKDAPYARQSLAALAELIRRHELSWVESGAPDRWGRVRAKVFVSGDQRSLQEQLVAAGSVRVNPRSQDYGLISQLYKEERIAQERALGLWAMAAYAVRNAEAPAKINNGFQCVKGRVVLAQKRAKRFYLNFGDDYRLDFTMSATATLASHWAEKGFDLASLDGEEIRVRGYVSQFQGPAMELHHPMQIQHPRWPMTEIA